MFSFTPAVDLVPDVFDDITRREFGVGALALGALALVGCGDDSGSGTTEGAARAAAFRFTGDDDVEVELDRVPTRIAAWVSNAATLVEFGVAVTAFWGPLELTRGVDMGEAVHLGGEDFLVNVEALAATQPEIIIGNVFNGEFSLPQEEEFDDVQAVAPVLRLEMNGAVVDMVEAHERLAVALGVDADGAELVAARAGFTAARDELESAIAAKPGLKVLCLALNAEDVFVSYLDYAPLIDLAGLGMDIHDNTEADPAWDDGYSWELVPDLAADLIIFDDRPRFLQPGELVDHPVWSTLPAVVADQVVGYPFDAPLSYGYMADVYRQLTEAVADASADVV